MQRNPHARPPQLIGSGQDKLGRDIDLFIEMDVELPNRGFVAHDITAYHGDVRLGFLRAVYIEKKAYERLNPTVWNHFSNFSGIGYLPDAQDPRTMDGQEAARFRKDTLHSLELWNHPDPGSYEAFEKVAKKADRFKKLMQSRKECFAYHLDNPYVDYVCTRASKNNHVFGDSRGMGIAKLLYCGAAHAMDDIGLAFYGSTLQSDEAKHVWESMGRDDWVGAVTIKHSNKERLLLHPERIPESFFRKGPRQISELSV